MHIASHNHHDCSSSLSQSQITIKNQCICKSVPLHLLNFPLFVLFFFSSTKIQSVRHCPRSATSAHIGLQQETGSQQHFMYKLWHISSWNLYMHNIRMKQLGLQQDKEKHTHTHLCADTHCSRAVQQLSLRPVPSKNPQSINVPIILQSPITGLPQHH